MSNPNQDLQAHHQDSMTPPPRENVLKLTEENGLIVVDMQNVPAGVGLKMFFNHKQAQEIGQRLMTLADAQV
jgi:hypothetical protein